MAYLDTLEDEERKKLELGGGAAPMSSGGAGAVQSQPKAPEPGFANLSNYFTANKDAAQAQGAELASGLESAATEALQSDSPGQAMDVYGQLSAAQTPGGLAATTKNDDPRYSAGMAGLDAYLGTRGAEPGQFQGLREMFGDRLKAVEPGMTYAPPSQSLRNYSASQGGQQAMSDWDKSVRDYIAWRVRREKNASGTELDPEALWREAYRHEVHGDPWENPDYWGGT